MLSATSGTLHAYYPYNNSVTSIQAVPVEAASLTDYMYATSVSGLSVSSNEAQVTLNHALTAIKLTLTRGTYSGTGKVTNLSVTSDALATDASLDATTGELSAITGAGTALAHDTDMTLTESAQSTVVTAVPTTATATVNITATVDGLPFAVTTSATAFRQGNVYEYSLTVNNEALILTRSAIVPWGVVKKDDVNIDLYDPWDYVEYVDPSTLSGGPYAYAVAPDGSLVKDVASLTTEMAQQCIAVALIVNDTPTPQRLWIEKNEVSNTASIKAAYEVDGATDTGYTYFYWGAQGDDTIVDEIMIWTSIGCDNTSTNGFLPKEEGTYSGTPNLSSDYTTWTSGALSDFNGKANTAALQAAPDTDSFTELANMATWCVKFNQSASENQGYTDWYIPACGQLALMFTKMTSIDEIFNKIGGVCLSGIGYWSSSQFNSYDGWCVGFGDGNALPAPKGTARRCRLVRNF